MKRIFLFLLCTALALPGLLAVGPVLAQSAGDGLLSSPGLRSRPLGFDAGSHDQLRVLERARDLETQAQVRVQRRVVVRIAPSSNATRVRLMAELPRRELRKRFEEEELGECVEIEQLVGVQPMEENRLLLITRDRQLLSASLERSCSAQAFYSGFYVEQNSDGQLCVNRDRLQSRAGDSCEISGLSRLVAVRD